MGIGGKIFIKNYRAVACLFEKNNILEKPMDFEQNKQMIRGKICEADC